MGGRESFFKVGKALGLFGLARRLSQDGLRILCYHSVALENEHTFLPKMFVSPQTFERRLAFLADHRFPVLPLDEAVRRLQEGTLPPGATTITFDDGLYGTYRLAWPLLRRFSMPATVYVTSYYVMKRAPVFGLLVEYMFWRSRKASLDLSGLGLVSVGAVTLTDPVARTRALDDIVEHGEHRCSEEQRSMLARRLADRLDVDYDAVARDRLFSLMTPEEIRELAAAGLDIQSHTHRHHFPVEEAVARRELVDNRAFLEPLTGRRLEHFCYPSGAWSVQQWPLLTTAGFKTATTCEPGFNYRETPRLALGRFLDGEHISDLEFEAEMYGYKELARRGRAGVRRIFRRAPMVPQSSGATQACESG